MKTLSLIGIALSLIMLITMFIVYLPILDAESTPEEYRVIMALSILFPVYFLMFSIIAAKKLGHSFKFSLYDEE